LLEEAERDGAVEIRRRDGAVFRLSSAPNPKASPLDVPGVKITVRTQELVAVVREGREPLLGDCVMKTTLIVFQSEADHADAKKLVEKLMGSSDPQDGVRMVAQARLVEAYERAQWPRTAPAAASQCLF
jgi:hypothetical protein